MTGYMFRATWPILPGVDRSPVGVRRLEVEASGLIDGLAAEAGCRLVPGRIRWRVTGDTLIGEAAAWPVGEVAA